MKLDHNDPKWTAYVLDELSEADRKAVEQELENNPEARKLVDEIRAFTGDLQGVLAREPELELATDKRQAILRESRKQPEGRILRLPVWAITSISTAAAALVIAVVGIQHYAERTERAEQLAMIDESATGPTVYEVVPSERADMEEVLMADVSRPAARVPEYSVPAKVETQVDDLDFRGRQMEVAAPAVPVAPASQPSDRLVIASARSGQREESEVVARRPVGYAKIQDGSFVAFAQPEIRHREQIPGQPFLSPSLDDFPELRDNKFIRVADHPLSTFSIDVDTASYAVMRKFLNEGRLPPKDSIRVEELINYFPYDYASPTDETPFAAHLEMAPCPWNPQNQLVRIALKGREIAADARVPMNLVFLIDVSGSMHPANKLPLVIRSMQALAKQLDERDQVAIVVYAGAAGMVLPPTRGDDTQTILEALDRLKAGGSTAGGSGIQLAYKTAREIFDAEAVNRVILCTDGDFNVGITQRGDLERLIEQEAKSGVYLTVLGFGMGNLKDSTLELLSNKGNGNYAYIDDFNEARKVLVDQMLGTLVTIAKDVKIQVEFNPARVAGYRLVGYENRLLKKEDFNNDRVDAGDIGAGHTVTAFYEIIPAGRPVTDAPVVDDLKYQPNAREVVESDSGEWLTVKLRYKQPDGDVSSKLEFPLTADLAADREASRDFRFAAAVAAFGQILRENEHVEGFTYDRVLALAEPALGDDPFGYRAEFLKLVRNAMAISGR